MNILCKSLFLYLFIKKNNNYNNNLHIEVEQKKVKLFSNTCKISDKIFEWNMDKEGWQIININTA